MPVVRSRLLVFAVLCRKKATYLTSVVRSNFDVQGESVTGNLFLEAIFPAKKKIKYCSKMHYRLGLNLKIRTSKVEIISCYYKLNENIL